MEGGRAGSLCPGYMPTMVELVAFFFIRVNDLYILFVHD